MLNMEGDENAIELSLYNLDIISDEGWSKDSPVKNPVETVSDIRSDLEDNDRDLLKHGSDWLSDRQGATLVWRDLCVYAAQDNSSNFKNFKRIINNSTGALKSGTLMAVMGASGSGKSTLMSALAYRQPIGTVVKGEILINGRRIGPFMHRISGFVHQEDLFIGSLTVMEHMKFMAHLRLDRRISKRRRHTIIQDLLERANLLSVVNTRIGYGDDEKVLSGGEKKRLAFATELLNSPIILFCDEPTTGLDSFSAQQMIHTLYSLAKKGTTVMCTIHQPSSQLFAMFNNVLLLADGRVAFMGSPGQALDFFKEHGYPCPEAYNPADYLIGVIASPPGLESASQRIAQHLCDLFSVSSAAKERDVIVNLEFHMIETSDYPFDTEIDEFREQLWYVTVAVMVQRLFLTVIREPQIQLLRFGQKVGIAIMISLCFFGTIDLSQLGVQAVQGVLFAMISENTFHPMYSILSLFPQSFPLFLREKRSGIYSTAQYYIANIIAMLPGMILEPFLFVVICYWLAGLKPTLYAFTMTAILIVLVMNVATACGCFFSTAFNSVPLAMAYLVPVDYIFMITSGVFIKISTIPSIFSWMQYLSWMLYANEAMSILQWEGVGNITCYEQNPDWPCLQTGQDVLEKYSFTEGHFAWNIFALIFLFLGFHFLGYFFLWNRARKV